MAEIDLTDPLYESDSTRDETGEECNARHPDFDRHWRQYGDLVWWWAKKVKRVFGGEIEDYVGQLVLRFNRSLYGWIPAKGKFSTYYGSRILKEVVRCMIRYESEANAVHYFNTHTQAAEKRAVFCSYAFHESNYKLYRVPDLDNDWVQECLSLFDSVDHFWRFLKQGLDNRYADILERRCRWGHTCEEISKDYNISKQRVSQIECRTKDLLKEKMRQGERFKDLFQIRQESVIPTSV